MPPLADVNRLYSTCAILVFTFFLATSHTRIASFLDNLSIVHTFLYLHINPLF